MSGSDGKLRASLDVWPDNAAELMLRDSSGRVTVAAGTLRWYMGPEPGKYEMRLVSHPEHTIEVLDTSGKVKWSAP
jgi:hypothetical protein